MGLEEVCHRPHWWPGCFRERQDWIDSVLALPLTNRETPTRFSFTVGNPNESGSMYGFRVLQLQHIGRMARLNVAVYSEQDPGSSIHVQTKNVRVLAVHRTVVSRSIELVLNGTPVSIKENAVGDWLVLSTLSGPASVGGSPSPEVRGITTYPGGGLAQFLKTSHIIIVVGRSSRLQEKHLSVATRLAHMFYLFGSFNSSILWDDQVEAKSLSEGNTVYIGGTDENQGLAALGEAHQLPAEVHSRYFLVGRSVFNEPGTGEQQPLQTFWRRTMIRTDSHDRGTVFQDLWPSCPI